MFPLSQCQIPMFCHIFCIESHIVINWAELLCSINFSEFDRLLSEGDNYYSFLHAVNYDILSLLCLRWHDKILQMAACFNLVHLLFFQFNETRYKSLAQACTSILHFVSNDLIKLLSRYSSYNSGDSFPSPPCMRTIFLHLRMQFFICCRTRVPNFKEIKTKVKNNW